MSGKTDSGHVRSIFRIALIRMLFILLLIPLWVLLRSVYRDRLGAFGCFDDCNNIVGGYFLTQGRHLFSQIFFNHMPGMAYISEWIQRATNPESIYMLIYQHRMFMIYASIAADILLVLRFGFAGFGFAVLYESTKGFFFGERFLAEGLIIYPLVYLFGIVLLSVKSKKVAPLDVFVAMNCAWFILFMREPYIPLAFWLFGILLWRMRRTFWSLWSLTLFTLMSWVTVYYHGFADFVFNVYTVNKLNIATESHIVATQSGGIASIIFYPVLLFFKGPWNLSHQIEVALVMVFVLSIMFLIRRTNYLWPFVTIGITLALANIRPIAPGVIYYQAFHHLIWYGLLVFVVVHLLREVWTRGSHILSIAGVGIFIALAGYAIVSPQSYIHEHVDRAGEFTTNYSHYYVVGSVISRLSTKGDTLFLDGYDDLIYWQAKLPSPYLYSWYTSLMPYFPVYQKARLTMFRQTPPTFYYGSCSAQTGSAKTMPSTILDTYVRFTENGKPSCLYVLKSKAVTFTAEQLKSIEQFNYSIPTEVN